MENNTEEIREEAREKSFQATPQPIRKTTLITVIVFAIIVVVGVIMIAKFFSVL